MAEKSLKENVQNAAVKKVLAYLDKDPDKNMPKLLPYPGP